MKLRTGPREEEMGVVGMFSHAVLVEQQWDSGEKGKAELCLLRPATAGEGFQYRLWEVRPTPAPAGLKRD